MKRTTGGTVLTYAAAVLVAIGCIAPLAWTFLASVSTQADIVARPARWWPSEFVFDRYATILFDTSSATARTSEGGADASGPRQS